MKKTYCKTFNKYAIVFNNGSTMRFRTRQERDKIFDKVEIPVIIEVEKEVQVEKPKRKPRKKKDD